jgi:hypothetical protein
VSKGNFGSGFSQDKQTALLPSTIARARMENDSEVEGSFEKRKCLGWPN